MHHFIRISFVMIFFEILMMMMTIKLTELNKFLTLLMFLHLFYSSVVAQINRFISQRSHKKELLC